VSQNFDDYDLVIIVALEWSGHGAALHAVIGGLKQQCEAADMGGTCINQGCIPSKALLAAAGRVQELQCSNLKSLGILTGSVGI